MRKFIGLLGGIGVILCLFSLFIAVMTDSVMLMLINIVAIIINANNFKRNYLDNQGD